MRRPHRSMVGAFVALCLAACGGGGTEGGGDGAVGGQVGPDIALLFVSGHTGLFTGQDDPSYLSAPGDAGPAIVAELQARGYSVSVDYFVDDSTGDAVYLGY